MRTVEIVLALVALGTVVAVFARRWAIPAPSLLVLAGIAVSVAPGVPTVRVAPDIVSFVVLPPLLYAAGTGLSWRDVAQVWRPVTVLSVGLVVSSAVAVAAVTVALTPVRPLPAFVLGSVLASTDPVAVTALGRRLGLPSRIQGLVLAESLFNDATSLVLFRVAVTVVVAGGSLAWGHSAILFVQLGGGGALLGTVVGAGVLVVRQRVDDPVVETVIALMTPYVAYVGAEAAHASGVTAVVAAALLVGNRTRHSVAAPIRLQVDAVYGTLIFVLESVVFALIGLQLPGLIGDLGAHQRAWPLVALALAASLLVARAAWVFPLGLLGRDRARRRRWPAAAVVSWAGARGVVPLVAALSIPLTGHGGHRLDHRPLLLVLATAVITLTLVVQGLSLGPLVRRSGLGAGVGAHRDAAQAARRRLDARARQHLDDLAEGEVVPTHVLEHLRGMLDHRSGAGDAGSVPDQAEVTYLALRRQLITVQRTELERLHQEDAIDTPTHQHLQRVLDLEDAALEDRET